MLHADDSVSESLANTVLKTALDPKHFSAQKQQILTIGERVIQNEGKSDKYYWLVEIHWFLFKQHELNFW